MTFEKIIEWLGPIAVDFVVDVIACILIYFIGKKLIALALKLLDRVTERSKMDLGVARFLHSFCYFGLYAVMAFLIIAQLGINTSSIMTIVSAGVLALGVAFQGSLANIAGGVLILLMRPFRVGDYVTTNYGDGTVKMIGLVYTTLVTVNNLVITIPNGELANSAVTDITANPERRVDFTFGIGYDADLIKAKEIIREVLLSEEGTVRPEDMRVFVNKWQDSSIELGAWLWIDRTKYFDILWDVNEKVKLRFDEEGIRIPFPQVDVHLDGPDPHH